MGLAAPRRGSAVSCRLSAVRMSRSESKPETANYIGVVLHEDIPKSIEAVENRRRSNRGMADG